METRANGPRSPKTPGPLPEVLVLAKRHHQDHPEVNRGRPMEKTVLAAVLLATFTMGACTACSNDGGSSSTAEPTLSSAAAPSTPSSAATASSARTSASDDVPPPPKVGQCRNTPASNLETQDWVDQPRVVNCSKTHPLQPLVVIKPVEKLTLAQAKQ